MTIQQGVGGAFGEEIAWKNYADGIEAIRANHKPGMLVFHRGSCPSCHRLAREVKGNQKVLKLSKHFVMVSCDGNEPKSELFTFGTFSAAVTCRWQLFPSYFLCVPKQYH